MLSFALALLVVAAPRGFPAVHTVELVTQVDGRVEAWLNTGDERKALLATEKELHEVFKARAEAKALVAAAVQEQAQKAAVTHFEASSALIDFEGKVATLSLFGPRDQRLVMKLLAVGTEKAPRYVLMSGPTLDERALREVADEAKAGAGTLVYAEKHDGAWSTATLPARPPPDCALTLRNAAKTLFTAEKAYFAEKDAYSSSLQKIGVVVTSLGVTGAKVKVQGTAPAQSFIAEVSLKGGVLQMDQKGTVTEIAPCTP